MEAIDVVAEKVYGQLVRDSRDPHLGITLREYPQLDSGGVECCGHMVDASSLRSDVSIVVEVSCIFKRRLRKFVLDRLPLDLRSLAHLLEWCESCIAMERHNLSWDVSSALGYSAALLGVPLSCEGGLSGLSG